MLTRFMIVQEAINYMRSNLDKRLSLEDIAGNVNYSPSHFGQIFHKKTWNFTCFPRFYNLFITTNLNQRLGVSQIFVCVQTRLIL